MSQFISKLQENKKQRDEVQRLIDARKRQDERTAQVVKTLEKQIEAIKKLNLTDSETEKKFSVLVKQFQALSDSIIKAGQALKSTNELAPVHTDKVLDTLTSLVKAVSNIEFQPKISVEAPEVVVPETKLDLQPLLRAVKALKLEVPATDLSDVTKGLSSVERAVKDLIAKPVPVPEYPTTIKVSDSSGNDILDPTQGYAPSDVDETSDPKYYGFLKADGSWYIMKNTSDTTYRYITGSSDYATNWTNRASLTYSYFSEAF